MAQKAHTVSTSAGGTTGERDRESRGAALDGCGKERYEITFSISKAQLGELEEAKSLISGKYPKGVKLEHVFGKALEALLEKRSPKRREARREKRVKRVGRVSAPKKKNRHIPREVRDKVFLRDGGRCTFVGADGVRCGETHDVEVHHVRAFCRGGRHGEENLRLLCRRHNVYEAEREFWEGHVVRCVVRVREAAAGEKDTSV